MTLPLILNLILNVKARADRLFIWLASCAVSDGVVMESRDDGSGTGGVASDGIMNGDEKFVLTSNLDTMAGEGTVLNRHYCPAPVSAPSRGPLLSGMHQRHANVRNRQFDKANSYIVFCNSQSIDILRTLDTPVEYLGSD